MIIELKWDKEVNAAIDQIREKNYPNVLKEYGSGFLMVGITYNSRTNVHECVIEKSIDLKGGVT